MCGFIKDIFPDTTITFLGCKYTQAVIETCEAVDHFIDYDQLKALSAKDQIDFLKTYSIDACIHVFPDKTIAALMKKVKIPLRIGTANRLYHWFTCNKLVHLSRRKSNLHEAELNMRLMKGLGVEDFPCLKELPKYYFFSKISNLPDSLSTLLDKKRFNLVLHPKSHGSGKEWSLKNFEELISLLPVEKFQIFITGSEREKVILDTWIKKLPVNIINLTGRLSLPELIAFLNHSDGLIASGTGPLHIAAATGIYTLGLFPNIRPIFAQRWAPIGHKAEYIESPAGDLNVISALMIYNTVKKWMHDNPV